MLHRHIRRISANTLRIEGNFGAISLFVERRWLQNWLLHSKKNILSHRRLKLMELPQFLREQLFYLCHGLKLSEYARNLHFCSILFSDLSIKNMKYLNILQIDMTCNLHIIRKEKRCYRI